MKKRYLFIIFLIFILSVSIVSATTDTQNNDTSIQQTTNTHTNTNTKIIKEDTNKNIYSKDTNKINPQKSLNKKNTTQRNNFKQSTARVTNFDELKQAILAKTNIINMTKTDDSDYNVTEYLWRTPIESADITIIGNGITLDGHGDTVGGENIQAFLDINYNSKIVIKDLIFENFYTNFGTIYISEDYNDVTLTNCTFKNNAGYTTSIISMYYDSRLNVINSTFINNSIQGTYASAITGVQYVPNEAIKIMGSKFINNTNPNPNAGHGPVYSTSTFIVLDSEFEENSPSNFKVLLNSEHQKYIKLNITDNYLTDIQTYEVYLDGEQTPSYTGINIEQYTLPDYDELKIVVKGNNPSLLNNNTYILKAEKPPITEINVTNYQELADAIDQAKTLTSNPITITLLPGGNYNATTDIIWGKTLNDGTPITGDIEAKTLIINGNGTLLDGNNRYSFINIEQDYNLTIANITLSNYTKQENGAVFYVNNQAMLNASNVTFTDNNAIKGAAIFNNGKINITNATFKNNNAEESGATIYNTETATSIVQDSKFINNTPENFELQKINGKNTIIITQQDNYIPQEATVTIYENNQYKGVFNIENLQVKDYEVPTGKVQLQLIIDSTRSDYFNNNNYTFESNIKQIYHAEITTLDDVYSKVKINVTIKNETDNPVPNQPVNLTLPGGTKIEDITDENGTIIFTPALEAGSQDLMISIEETEDNEELTTQYNIIVKQFSTTTVINVINSTVVDTTINVTVTDNEGNRLNKGNIIVTDEEGNYIGTGYIKNYESIIKLDLPLGTQEITAIYVGNSTHAPSNRTTQINVKHQAMIDIIIQNNTEGNVTADIIITNEEGTPIQYQEIEITLPNGTPVTQRTGALGQVTINDQTATAGNRNITVTVPDTQYEKGATKTTPINILIDYKKLIDELNKTIQDMNGTIQDMNGTINDLNGTVQDMNSTIRDMNGTINDLNGTVQDMNSTIRDMNGTINDLNGTVQDMNSTIRDMNGTINDLNGTVQDMNSTIRDMNGTINDLNGTVQDMNSTIRDMNGTINDLNGTVQDMNSTIRDMNGTINDLNDTVRDMNSTIRDMNGTINDLNDTVNNQQGLINDLNDTVRDMNSTIRDMNGTINDLNDTVRDMNSTIRDMNGTINDLNDTVRDMNSTIRDMNGTINDLNDTVNNQQGLINDLNDTVRDMNSTIRDMNGTINDLNDTVNNQQGLINDLNDTVRDMNSTIRDMNGTINDLNNTVNNQQKTIGALNNTVNNQQKTIGDLNNTVNNQQKTIGALNNTVNNQQKTIGDLNNTVNNQQKTIGALNNTVNNQQKTIGDLNNTVNNQQKTINNLNNTVNDQQKTINNLNNLVNQLYGLFDDLNKTVKNLTEEVDTLQEELDTRNKTTVMDLVPDGNKVGNATVDVKLTNKLGDPIKNAKVNAVLPNGTVVGTATTDDNGKTVVPLNVSEGTQPITVVYPGNGFYKNTTSNITIDVTKNNVTLDLNPIKGVIGEDITLVAKLTDQNGNLVNGGNLVFKLNGKTLRTDGRFDSSAPAWKFSVKNGLVTVTIKADLYLRDAKNLSASYSGSYKYEEKSSDVVEAQIQKRNAQIKVVATPTSQKQYESIKITATVTDITKNHKNTTILYQNSSVIFKVNGVTLKDAKGRNIYVPLAKDGTATINYTIPQGMGGITNNKTIRNYPVTAIFSSDNYYPDIKNETYFQVERSNTTIDIKSVTVTKDNQLSVKATLKDYKNNNLIGTNKVTIKINGKSYVDPSTGQPKYWSVKDGVVDLSGIEVDPKTTIKRVMIVTGERQAYLEGRNETTNIIRV